AIRDVDAGRLRFDASAALIEAERPVRPQRPAHALRRLETVLDPDLGILGCQPLEHRLDAWAILVGDEVPNVASDESLARRALGTRVAAVREEDLTVQAKSADHLGLRVHDRAIALFAAPERLLDAVTTARRTGGTSAPGSSDEHAREHAHDDEDREGGDLAA